MQRYVSNTTLDMGIVVEHMVLTATELGLGTCWLGYFSEKRIKKLLGIPGRTKIAALLSLGYASETRKTKERRRKNINEIYSIDSYMK